MGSPMSRTTRTTLVFLGIFIAGVVYFSMTIAQHQCEVCITFRGRTVCRTAASGTREASIESAVSSACGTLAAGMTESIRCSNTKPDLVDCRGR